MGEISGAWLTRRLAKHSWVLCYSPSARRRGYWKPCHTFKSVMYETKDWLNVPVGGFCGSWIWNDGTGGIQERNQVRVTFWLVHAKHFGCVQDAYYSRQFWQNRLLVFSSSCHNLSTIGHSLTQEIPNLLGFYWSCGLLRYFCSFVYNFFNVASFYLKHISFWWSLIWIRNAYLTGYDREIPNQSDWWMVNPIPSSSGQRQWEDPQYGLWKLIWFLLVFIWRFVAYIWTE